MAVFVSRLSSFDVYTKYPPGQVIETDILEDVCSGMNPCYYIYDKDRLKVSSSVLSLVIESGNFEINNNFKPPKFFMHPWQRKSMDVLRNILNTVEKAMRNTSVMQSASISKLKSITPDNVKRIMWDSHYSAHISCETIDARVRKLKPFESVSFGNEKIGIDFDYAITDMDEFLEKTALYLRKSINDIEEAYPDKKHIILMGGKDSQLISLIPKLNDSNWYVFSAEPNYSIVKDWIKQNNISVKKIFMHDGRNEEKMVDYKKKVRCSDLYTNLIHIRYAPSLERIADEFDHECVFWLGSMPRRASLYDGGYRKPGTSIGRDEFFNVHLNTFPGWQGNIQQTYSNYIGCPFLTPYYLKDIWFNVNAHLDPDIIVAGQDYRPQLGELLAGREISWPTQNPGPEPYKYWYLWFKPYKYYINYIKRKLRNGS
jgi:hypothetical protein